MKWWPWSTQKKADPLVPSDGAIVIDVAGMRNSGQYSAELALKIEAVFACLRDKSESIGQIPVKMYAKSTGKKAREEVKSGRNYRIFCQNPCDYMTMQTFMEMLVVSLERFGAFYAYIERNDRGTPMSIIPFRFQGNIRPNMDVNGNVYYTYLKNDGTQGDPYRIEDLFIVKGFTVDGFTPMSPLVQTATMLGIADAQETSQYEAQSKGITAQMALSTDQVFKDDNMKRRLKDEWDEFRGPAGRTKIPIFEQGLKPVSLKLTPAETELLKNREYTVNRICRAFRVPLHRVGVAATNTGTGNVFELDEAYMRDALNPILKKAESAFNSLVPAGFEIEFDRNAFYSGSPWRLLQHIEKAVKGGLMTVNEGRGALGWEPVEGGDVFAIDNNNVVYGFWHELEQMQERLYGNKPTGANSNDQQNP